MYIQKADFEQLDQILKIYQSAREFMRSVGNPNQWGQVNPPAEKTIEDITSGKLYVVLDNYDEILAVFYFDLNEDPTYKVIYDGKWLNDMPYGVIHRIAVSESARGRGVAKFCFDYAYDKCKNLRIDTHIDNIPMQRALAKSGFRKCGIIHLLNGDSRIAFQKSEDCYE